MNDREEIIIAKNKRKLMALYMWRPVRLLDTQLRVLEEQYSAQTHYGEERKYVFYSVLLFTKEFSDKRKIFKEIYEDTYINMYSYMYI